MERPREPVVDVRRSCQSQSGFRLALFAKGTDKLIRRTISRHTIGRARPVLTKLSRAIEHLA